MMTFSSSKDAACRVQTGSATFDVFPTKVTKDVWALLSKPEDELVNKKAISWPGEYDFEGVTVRAVGQDEGKQVSYACHTEGMRSAYVGAPVLDWTDAELEKLGDVDILVVSADNPKKVTALVEAVDPRVVILCETKDGDLAGVTKSLGVSSVQPVSEFKAKHGSLPSDSRQIVVLK